MSELTLLNGDCLELMKGIPDGSVDLVLTDPPYNGKNTYKKDNEAYVFDWDYRDDYIEWCIEWLSECQRVLSPSGVLYFWHNDIETIADLLVAIRQKTGLVLQSFCVWNKGETYRARSWSNRDPAGATSLRSWFNICEYCLHFFNAPKDADPAWGKTGLDRINSNPECYKPLKEWYVSELERLGITEKDIAEKYTEVTGRKPYMLRHYFQNSQFEIPTKEVWENAYMPLGFGKDYEALRKDYEALRNFHVCDEKHCNVWNIPPIPSVNRLHTCQKPVEILERLIRVSCPESGTVLDCFMGSGSTGVACQNTERDFIGIELDKQCFDAAKQRMEQNAESLKGNSPIERMIAKKEQQLNLFDFMETDNDKI